MNLQMTVMYYYTLQVITIIEVSSSENLKDDKWS